MNNAERPGALGARALRRTQSVADSVAEAIEDSIREDSISAGTRLGTKQDLCDRFQIAPATLGEAMRILRTRGIIEVRPGPGGGIFVAEISPLLRLAHSVRALRENGATVSDVIGVLDALDEAVACDAAEHRTARDLRDLDALFADLTAVWEDPAERINRNWDLHHRIAEITPNVVLRTFYQNLVDYIRSEIANDPAATIPNLGSESPARLEIHGAIIEAIRGGDPEQARAAILAHRLS